MAPALLPMARCASAISASVPPSPLLSARSRMTTYFERDDDDQRPQDQRQHAEHRLAVRRAIGADRGDHRLAQARRAGSCRCRRRPRRCCRASAARSGCRSLAVGARQSLAGQGRVDVGHGDVAGLKKLGQYCCTAINFRSALIWPRRGRCPATRLRWRDAQPCRKNRYRGQSIDRRARTSDNIYCVQPMSIDATITRSPGCRPRPPGRSGSGRSRWRRTRSWRAR